MTQTMENRVLDRILDDLDAIPAPPTSADLAQAIHVLRRCRWLDSHNSDIDVMSMDGLTIAVASGDRRVELVKAVEAIADEAEGEKESARIGAAYSNALSRILRGEKSEDVDLIGDLLEVRERPARWEQE